MPMMMPSQAGGLANALQPQTGGLLQRLLGGSAQPSSGLGSRLTDLLNPQVALPMAGAMIAGRTPAAGIGDAFALGGLGLGKLNDKRKTEADKNRTRDALAKTHPELAQMIDMGLPVEDAWKEALKLDHPPKGNWLSAGDGSFFNTDTEEFKSMPQGAGGGGMFEGKSVEAQGLNYLIQSGAITQDQAANMAAGKTVTNPVDGSVMFLTPQGVFSQDPAGGAPKPVGAGAPQPASATGDPLVSPTGGNPGLIPITGPKQIKETDTQRNRKFQVDQATKAVESGLDSYEAAVKKSGLSVLPGEEQDNLNTARQNVMLQMKELYNLGVLNGPDLALMEKMIYDPVVDLDKGWMSIGKQGLTALGVGGTPAQRAANNVKTLKAQLRQIREAAMSADDGVTTGAPAGDDGVVDAADYFKGH